MGLRRVGRTREAREGHAALLHVDVLGGIPPPPLEDGLPAGRAARPSSSGRTLLPSRRTARTRDDPPPAEEPDSEFDEDDDKVGGDY